MAPTNTNGERHSDKELRQPTDSRPKRREEMAAQGPKGLFGTECDEAHSREYASTSAAARRGAPRVLKPRHGYSQTPRNRPAATADILTLQNTACRAWMGPPGRGRSPRHWGDCEEGSPHHGLAIHTE